MSRMRSLVVVLLSVLLMAGLVTGNTSPADAAPKHAPRIIIPSRGVNAVVVQTNIVNGEQQLTNSTHEFMHPRGSLVPGQHGHSVFADHFCHFGCSYGLGNVLASLKKGTVVQYVGSTGKQVCGAVTSVKRFADVSSKRLNRWYNTVDGPSIGMFITCRLNDSQTSYEGSVLTTVRWHKTC